jgi:HSP20 family molecular chaperone IbpA
MNTRVSVLDHPFFLGFDRFEREFDRLKKSSDAYPPYNVEQNGEDGLRIVLAVAGFHMDDLDIEIDKNQLTIRGKQNDDSERVYLHRGIAARQFQRSFVLADGIEVHGAYLDHGLLHIEMARVIPESTARKIKIATPENKGGGKALNAPHGAGDAIDIEVNREGKTKSPKKGGK